MMLANDLKTYYDEVRRYLDCPKDEQDRLLLSVNKQILIWTMTGSLNF